MGNLRKSARTQRRLRRLKLISITAKICEACVNMLAQDPEKMKSLIAFKKSLEDQLEKLNAETKEIQDLER